MDKKAIAAMILGCKPQDLMVYKDYGAFVTVLDSAGRKFVYTNEHLQDVVNRSKPAEPIPAPAKKTEPKIKKASPAVKKASGSLPQKAEIAKKVEPGGRPGANKVAKKTAAGGPQKPKKIAKKIPGQKKELQK